MATSYMELQDVESQNDSASQEQEHAEDSNWLDFVYRFAIANLILIFVVRM